MLHSWHLQLIPDPDKELFQLNLRLTLVNFEGQRDRTWWKVPAATAPIANPPPHPPFSRSKVYWSWKFCHQSSLLPSHFNQSYNLATSCRSPCSNCCAAFCGAQTQSHFQPTLFLAWSYRTMLGHRLFCKNNQCSHILFKHFLGGCKQANVIPGHLWTTTRPQHCTNASNAFKSYCVLCQEDEGSRKVVTPWVSFRFYPIINKQKWVNYHIFFLLDRILCFIITITYSGGEPRW